MYFAKKSRPRPRQKPGKMNKLELRYAEKLQDMVMAGKIISYEYEPIKFKLAPRTFYTPDFFVVTNDFVEFHEVKGFLEDDAAVKFKAAAEKYSEFVWKMIRLKNGVWEFIYNI